MLWSVLRRLVSHRGTKSLGRAFYGRMRSGCWYEMVKVSHFRNRPFPIDAPLTDPPLIDALTQPCPFAARGVQSSRPQLEEFVHLSSAYGRQNVEKGERMIALTGTSRKRGRAPALFRAM